MGLFSKRVVEDSRLINFGEDVSEENQHFLTNYVTTAKYTLITFLPKNLFEQFTRVANAYFLLISLLQQIPGISPTGKYTTALPLTLVLAVTAAKEAYEDYKRHQSDKEVNNRTTHVLRTISEKESRKGIQGSLSERTWVKTLWSDVKVGDIVKINNKEPFCADMIVLSTSREKSMCYIETAQLDGETNLKIRQGVPATADVTEVEQCRKFTGEIECEPPNNRLYDFSGALTLNGKKIPLENNQVLLRGSVLRNTPWVIGLVIYSGHESKQMMNSSEASLKRTNVERTTNVQIIYVFAFLCLLAMSCAIGSSQWMSSNQDEAWYLRYDDEAAAYGALQFLTFIILYNNLIPISLYVTIEMVKFTQAILINCDEQMYYPEKDTPAQARTSNLNEELGQVQYIFSDKTGTLTRNLMEFRKCSIGGISYGYGTTEIGIAAAKRAGTYSDTLHSHPNIKNEGFEDERLLENLKNGHPTAGNIDEFLTMLAVCHTVIPEKVKTGLVYEAASPDEGALVDAARNLGFVFSDRGANTVTVKALGQERVYEVLNVLEFTSTRKRMSVIVRTPSGQIKLYCKGADSVIYPRLSKDSPGLSQLNTHLVTYANEGLRTLVFGVSVLDEATYTAWAARFHEASVAIKDREAKLAACSEEMEQELMLVGASAIEDKLQAGVPDAIAQLAKASIKIWVLTGDKQETAINIGFACLLLTDEMTILKINEQNYNDTANCIERLLGQHSGSSAPLGLIIDGASLSFALENDLKADFLRLCTMCKAVVCCRVSPLQKALVVSLVKESMQSITLAIGDGANDVAMIQAAHVGVGISGEEGLQAARSADYAIAQFRYLERLLLIHGRYSYRRISKVILYSFYKNICLYLTQCWFTFHNGFSGQTLYEQWSLSFYNVFFSSLPIVALGVLDQDVSVNFAQRIPRLYRDGQMSKYFNFKVFWQWVSNAIYHSLILFFIPFYSLSHDAVTDSGLSSGLWLTGAIVYTVVIITINLKVALETSYWTYLNHITIWGSIAMWFIFATIYSTMWEGPIPVGPEMYDMITQMFSTPYFYFLLLITPVLALMRDYVWNYVLRTFYPSPLHICTEIEKAGRSGGMGQEIVRNVSFLAEEGRPLQEIDHV
eukprot:GCRY01001452.1.p1 GENE.GCRY01001452.1~~GCRY01001452.1.p1  ORF type:complete len:1119 (-),score=332.21 GCRY01001452.1:1076-4432(-)